MSAQDTTEKYEKDIPEIVFLRIGDVESRVQLTRRTVYRMVAAGTFPAPVNLTETRRAWVASEVTEWQQARMNDRK